MEKQSSPEVVQKVVRSLVVSLAPSKEIYNNFHEQKNPPSILRFYVGKKGQRERGDRRYTFLGGKLNPSENLQEGIQREVSEEAGLRFFGIPNQTVIGSWNYSSPKSGNREVLLTYNPVLSCEQITVGDPKMSGVATLKLEELKQLITEGQINGIPLEGHLTLGENGEDKVSMTPDAAQTKDASLLKALGWMGHMEDYLRGRFEKVFNSGNGSISEEQFEKEYETIVSDYMRKGLKVAVRRKKEEGTEQRHTLIEVLDGSYMGKDILYYLPELAVHGMDWSGLDQATEGVKIFVGFLKNTFGDFLQKEGLTSENYGRQMRDPQVLLERKTTTLTNLDRFFRNRLRETFGVNDTDLDEVSEHVQNFFRDLSNEIKVADPKLTKGLHQDFTLLNEVNNANFGYLLSLFSGFDCKENTPQTVILIRFEAGRQLLLLLKDLTGIKHYQEEVTKVKEGRLQTAVNNFFGRVVEEDVIGLDDEQNMRIRIRETGGHRVIVDEKPIKTSTSFLRKSFEERVKDISDFHTVSITFKDRDDNNLENSEFLIDQFQQFLETQFPHTQLTIKDKRSYGTNDYAERQKTERKVDGKRKGSQGSKFVRTKLIYQLGEEKLELIMYPFYSIPDENGKFWGWLETRIDDKDYVVRRLLAGGNGIPSTYDLLFPPDLYPHHFLHKLNAVYHK